MREGEEEGDPPPAPSRLVIQRVGKGHQRCSVVGIDEEGSRGDEGSGSAKGLE